jgi:ribosomal protein S18 acetylase RimI-like enzyme
MQGVPQDQREQAAAIYYDAFKQKLTPFLDDDPQHAIAAIADDMQLENAFVALRDGQVLGLVGFHHAGKLFVDLQMRTLFKRTNIFKGIWRVLLGILLTRKPGKGEFLLDGIAVHADARGQGIGTRLFDALFAFAEANDYTTIRLDVVNTNPRAQQLYERLGFEVVKTESVPFLKFLGFTAVTEMRRDVAH